MDEVIAAARKFADRVQFEYDLLHQAYQRTEEEFSANDLRPLRTMRVINLRGWFRRKWANGHRWRPYYNAAKFGASDELRQLLLAVRRSYVIFERKAEWMPREAALAYRIAKADLEDYLLHAEQNHAVRGLHPLVDPATDLAWDTPDGIAIRYSIAQEKLSAFRKRLHRWKDDSPASKGWKKVEKTGPRDPQYLFQPATVGHIIVEYRAE